MFFDIKKDELPRGMFKACIIPRPIAWISTISAEGITNLAPFSYFQAIADAPPMVMFAASAKESDMTPKDTVVNIEETGEFVINFTTASLAELVNLSSIKLSYNDSEIEKFHIPTKPSKIVKAPSVSISPVNFECIHVQTIDIPLTTRGNKMIMGKVVGMSIDDAVIRDGRVDPKLLDPLYRLGYSEYSTLNEIINLPKPMLC
jgi:flavin reductase (DIM6/NTAB) family NADH-FMN oxidoreductase RutF